MKTSAKRAPLHTAGQASSGAGSSSRSRPKQPAWVGLSDEELLELRFCDLGVRIEGTALERRVERLHEEMQRKGIAFRPHCWLSDEWFSPDGVPGIAIPFYLAHPRLARLEKNLIHEVEGSGEAACMRILRHEAGHAVDTAYRLRRRHQWREVFGKSSQPYPDDYLPRPHSKSYVQHLPQWYAQSHPTEDFAETFAVWLKPRSGWRSQYRRWPAYEKLLFVDETLGKLAGRKPLVRSRQRVDSLPKMKKKLREHYEEKCARYGIGETNTFDSQLRKIFSSEPVHARRLAASAFLRRRRVELCKAVAEWTGQYQYIIDQVLREMIDRCSDLKLRLAHSEWETTRDAHIMLTVQAMNYLHGNYHRVAL